MEHNKAPGPVSFPVEFYQVLWDLVKGDLFALFREFYRGNLPLYSLNFGTIILLPKSVEAMTIQQYRPICLLNVSFKIFTKVITNRLATVAQKVIQPTQSAFLPGQNMLLFYTRPFMKCIEGNKVGLSLRLTLKMRMIK
jgi:hypothetical protein